MTTPEDPGRRAGVTVAPIIDKLYADRDAEMARQHREVLR
jgi:hypothetical protein